MVTSHPPRWDLACRHIDEVAYRKIHAFIQVTIDYPFSSRWRALDPQQHRHGCGIIAPHLPQSSPRTTLSAGNFTEWGASLWDARRSRAHCIIQYKLRVCKLRVVFAKFLNYRADRRDARWEQISDFGVRAATFTNGIYKLLGITVLCMAIKVGISCNNRVN